MKYKFKVCRILDREESPEIISRFQETFDQDVFESKINADEMVELMQHLWNIANNRIIKGKNK